MSFETFLIETNKSLCVKFFHAKSASKLANIWVILFFLLLSADLNLSTYEKSKNKD